MTRRPGSDSQPELPDRRHHSGDLLGRVTLGGRERHIASGFDAAIDGARGLGCTVGLPIATVDSLVQREQLHRTIGAPAGSFLRPDAAHHPECGCGHEGSLATRDVRHVCHREWRPIELGRCRRKNWRRCRRCDLPGAGDGGQLREPGELPGLALGRQRRRLLQDPRSARQEVSELRSAESSGIRWSLGTPRRPAFRADDRSPPPADAAGLLSAEDRRKERHASWYRRCSLRHRNRWESPVHARLQFLDIGCGERRGGTLQRNQRWLDTRFWGRGYRWFPLLGSGALALLRDRCRSAVTRLSAVRRARVRYLRHGNRQLVIVAASWRSHGHRCRGCDLPCTGSLGPPGGPTSIQSVALRFDYECEGPLPVDGGPLGPTRRHAHLGPRRPNLIGRP